MYGFLAVHDLGFIKRLHGSVLQTLLAALKFTILRVFLDFLFLHSFFFLFRKDCAIHLRSLAFKRFLSLVIPFDQKRKPTYLPFDWFYQLEFQRSKTKRLCCDININLFVFYHFIKGGLVCGFLNWYLYMYLGRIIIILYKSIPDTRVVSTQLRSFWFFSGENFHAESRSVW